MARRKRNPRPTEPVTLHIESLSHEGRGIARHNGRTYFVFNALPGEKVIARVDQQRKTWSEATPLEFLHTVPDRITPKCAAFGLCGGCSLQHMRSEDQIAFKQKSLNEMMQHAGVKVGEWLTPLTGESWGYRRKARLGVKFVIKKNRLLIGFRERNKPYLSDMQRCEVLDPRVGAKLPELMALIESLQAREKIPQIEVAADDEHCALVLRNLEPLSTEDLSRLESFSQGSGFWIQLQSGDASTMTPLFPESQILSYQPMQSEAINVQFNPADFTQVNSEINQQMVEQAITFLDLKPEERVLDLFCGLGNFTLPIARRCARVTGVEGDLAMVSRAKDAALKNHIHNTEYFASDLSRPEPGDEWLRPYDKVLLDPPRTGAKEMMPLLLKMKAQTIVYVSCNPATLVRDAAELCAKKYRLSQLGVMDMFPQTAHVESMAVFHKLS